MMLTKISVCIGTFHILLSTALSQCEVQVVHDPDGVKDDHFGSSVGIDGEWAVVGAFGVGIGGAAYAFERVAGQWLQVAELTASDEAQNRLFGASVAIHGDWIAVGDKGHDGLGESSGVVYVFHNEKGIWSEHSILIADDNLAGDAFGWVVDLEADRLVVSAVGTDEGFPNAGAVYVFALEDSTWLQKAKIVNPMAAKEDLFGTGLSLSVDRILVGARGSDVAATNGGAAFVFHLESEVWELESVLTADDAENMAWFGEVVALDGPRALVGSYIHGLNQAGAAYLFERTDSGWNEGVRLPVADPASNDNLGTAVALAGNIALLGAVGVGSGFGAVYVCRDDGSGWRETNKLWVLGRICG